MSLSAYYGTGPSKHTYVDTSQPLSGLGASEGGNVIDIYEGVGGIPSRPTFNGVGGCGCRGTRGKLAGFGNEVLPDDGSVVSPPIDNTTGPKVQTVVVGLLVLGSLIAVGAAMTGSGKGASGKAIRANGRRKR